MASRNSGRGGRKRRGAADPAARALQRGEPDAALEVRERVRRIVSFRGYGIPPEDQADLVQEVMTQVWQAVGKPGFDPTAGFWGFIETISARRCIDWWRTRRQSVELDPALADGRSEPLAAALTRERSRQMLEVLAGLGAPCRELITLHFSQGKSYREIARLSGASEGALRVRMHRCIAEARDRLEERTAQAGRTGREDSEL